MQVVQGTLDVGLAYLEGSQGAMFGGCIMLVCVQGTGHHELTKARVVEPVMGRGRRVLALALVMDQVLLVWSAFLPFACKVFHKLGANGWDTDFFGRFKYSREVGWVDDVFLCMCGYFSTIFLRFPGDWQKCCVLSSGSEVTMTGGPVTLGAMVGCRFMDLIGEGPNSFQ